MTIRKSMRDFRNDHCDNIFWTAFGAQKVTEMMRDYKYQNPENVPEQVDNPEIMGAYLDWVFDFIKLEISTLAENNDCQLDTEVEETVDTVD